MAADCAGAPAAASRHLLQRALAAPALHQRFPLRPRRRGVAGLGVAVASPTAGLPPALRERLPEAQRLRLPMREGQRSLNLSNAVAVTVFEAWRQNGFG